MLDMAVFGSYWLADDAAIIQYWNDFPPVHLPADCPVYP
jgi:hypothetical protein